MRVLFLGRNTGTSLQRRQAMERLGIDVTAIDLLHTLPNMRIVGSIIHHAGAIGINRLVTRQVTRAIRGERFDLVWVEKGEVVSPRLVSELKKCAGYVLLYNVDDPFGPRERSLWRQVHLALPFYDGIVVVRSENVEEAFDRGARRVLRVFRSADEVAHQPRRLTAEDRKKWSTDVLFLGTWFPERGPFLLELVRRGVPLTIYGSHWSKAREWPELKAHFGGRSLEDPDEYARAIQCSKVALGLLSKGNRDLHTTRSLEIPSLGGVFCAERTTEHLELYRENEEAVFWSDAAECAEVCKKLLADEEWRKSIALRGRARYLRDGWQNEKVIARVISWMYGESKTFGKTDADFHSQQENASAVGS